MTTVSSFTFSLSGVIHRLVDNTFKVPLLQESGQVFPPDAIVQGISAEVAWVAFTPGEISFGLGNDTLIDAVERNIRVEFTSGSHTFSITGISNDLSSNQAYSDFYGFLTHEEYLTVKFNYP